MDTWNFAKSSAPPTNSGIVKINTPLVHAQLDNISSSFTLLDLERHVNPAVSSVSWGEGDLYVFPLLNQNNMIVHA